MYLNLTVTALRTLEKKEAVRSAEGVVRDRERGRAKASEQVGVATARVVEFWRRREEEEQEVVVEAAMAAMAMAGILAICCNKRVEVIPRKKRLPHTHTHTHTNRESKPSFHPLFSSDIQMQANTLLTRVTPPAPCKYTRRSRRTSTKVSGA